MINIFIVDIFSAIIEIKTSALILTSILKSPSAFQGKS